MSIWARLDQALRWSWWAFAGVVWLCGIVLFWLCNSIWRLVKHIALQVAGLARTLLVPSGSSPFEILKHYASVVISIAGLTGLVWAGKQILHPPIVITIATLPKPLTDEYWLDPAIARSVVDRIERMRDVVKRERDPSFEAVLNAPNVVIKTGEFSLNIQEQILNPLGELLGRSPGEAHISLTCAHPGCRRTTDKECLDVVASAADGDGKVATPKPASPQAGGATGNNYLCLKLIADIRRYDERRRITEALVLSNKKFDLNFNEVISRVAEQITSVADPATAALYFYLQTAREWSSASVSPVERDTQERLRGHLFAAAERAETLDAVSACWAHTVRARVAIDRGEFQLADTYLARAGNIEWWQHLVRLSPPSDCQRLVAFAKLEWARRFVKYRSPTSIPFPRHDSDTPTKRTAEALRRVDEVMAEVGGALDTSWAGRIERAIRGNDIAKAATFARGEVLLNRWRPIVRCNSGAEPSQNALDSRQALVLPETQADLGNAIGASVASLEAMKKGRKLGTLTKQAAVSFVYSLSQKRGCLGQAAWLAEKIYVNHPDDIEAAKLFAHVIEQQSTVRDEKEMTNSISSDQGSFVSYFRKASQVYERMIDIGKGKDDIYTLSRAALLNVVYRTSFASGDDASLDGPSDLAIKQLGRAWSKYVAEGYPVEYRDRAENVLALWATLMLLNYEKDVAVADLSRANLEEKFQPARASLDEFKHSVGDVINISSVKSISSLIKVGDIKNKVIATCIIYKHAAGSKNQREEFIRRYSEMQRNLSNVTLVRIGLLRAFDGSLVGSKERNKISEIVTDCRNWS